MLLYRVAKHAADAEEDAEAVTCAGFPPAPARANFTFDDCKDMLDGEDCEAECDEDHEGIVIATCMPDGTFQVEGSCRQAEDDPDRRKRKGPHARGCMTRQS